MRKIVTTVLSITLMFSSYLTVMAEGEMPTEDTDTEELNEETTPSVDVDAETSYGFIADDLDYNTPVYEEEEIYYSNLEESYTPDYSVYPSVRNQNPYGTCWAFSSLGLAEFDLINDGKATSTIDLSELQFAYFTYNFVVDPLGGTEGDTYIDSSPYSFLDRGGNYVYSSRRLMQWISPTEETRVPYSNAKSVLTNGLDSSYAYSNIKAHLSNVYLINIEKNKDEVKKMIKEHGAVGVSYRDDNDNRYYNSELQKYVFYDTSGEANHAVMIVGWDDNFSKDYFSGTNKPTSDGAWLVRNSWGDFCDYFWMSYETGSLRDTAWVFDFTADDGLDNNYQLDGNYSVAFANPKTVANIFTVQEKDGVASENLKAVSISYMNNANVSYEVKVYTNLTDASNPYSGTLQDKATTTGTTKFAGVYTIDLASVVKLQPGSTFAIVVTTNNNKYIDYEAGNADKTGGAGKSLRFNGSSFVTWDSGNFCIKAYTSNNEGTTYRIHYELDEGTNDVNNPTIVESNNEEITLLNPTKDGYEFKGWYTESTYTNKIEKIPANISKDYTLYAKWEKIYFLNKDEFNTALTSATSLMDTVNLYFGNKSNYSISDLTLVTPLNEDHYSLYVKDTDVYVLTDDEKVIFPKDCENYFYNNTKLNSITFKDTNTAYVLNMNSMFAGCTNLKRIYASSNFETSSLVSGNNVFTGCNSLIGGKGTKYNSAYTSSTYARLDGGSTSPGYFTTISHKGNHTWDTGVITTTPTCETAGVKTYTCTECGETYTESVAALGHSFTAETVKAEALKTAGTCIDKAVYIKSCKNCGQVDTNTSNTFVGTVDSTNHSYSNWKVTKEATCTEVGSREKVCSRCGNKVTETIAKIAHSYSSEWTIDQEATTSSEGSKSHHCTRCGAKTDVTVIPKLISFIDVDSSTDHNAAIMWLAGTGISKGWSVPNGLEFRPYATVKRCDMSAFLKRLGGVLGDKTISSYTPSNWNRFVDVAKGDGIHEEDILWLADNEISTGWNDGTFRPLNDVTRADMAAFLRRLAKKYNIGDAATWTPSESDWATFSDLTRGDDYHQADILWLAHAGISQGWLVEDGTKEFRPMETVKRCDMAAFLQRLANLASK